jgi:acyl carrier protein
VVSEAIAKQVVIDNFKVDDVKLDVNLASEYELDSVDVVAVMLYLETHFSKEIKKAGVKIPVHKVEKVQTGQDLFNVMVEVLKGIEDKAGSIGSNSAGNSATK